MIIDNEDFVVHSRHRFAVQDPDLRHETHVGVGSVRISSRIFLPLRQGTS
jgi:hypothetical protein